MTYLKLFIKIKIQLMKYTKIFENSIIFGNLILGDTRPGTVIYRYKPYLQIID